MISTGGSVVGAVVLISIVIPYFLPVVAFVLIVSFLWWYRRALWLTFLLIVLLPLRQLLSRLRSRDQAIGQPPPLLSVLALRRVALRSSDYPCLRREQQLPAQERVLSRRRKSSLLLDHRQPEVRGITASSSPHLLTFPLAYRWLGFRLDFFGALLTFVVAIL